MLSVVNKAKHTWRSVRATDDRSRFATDVLVQGVSNVFGNVQGLAVLPLISIGLGIREYGIWTQVSSTAVLLLPLVLLGLDQAAVRYLPELREDRDQTARAFFGMLLLIWLVCALAGLVAWACRYTLSRAMLGADGDPQYIGFLVLLVAGQVSCRYLLTYWRAMRRIASGAAITMSMDALVMIGLFLVVMCARMGVRVALLYWAGLQWAFSAFLLYRVLRELPFRTPQDPDPMLRYLRYASPLVLFAVVTWVLNSSDRYFIVNYLDLSQAGLYSAAYTLSSIATSVQIPLNFVLFPTITTFWAQGDMASVREYVERGIGIYLAIATPLVVELCVGAPVLLRVFAGVVVREGWLVLWLVAIAYLCTGLDQSFRNVLLLQERTGSLFLTLAPIALLNLALNYLLIPRYGILGAGAATVASMGLKAIVLYLQSLRGFSYGLDWQRALRIGLCCMPMLVLAWLLPTSTVPFLMLHAVLAGILYLASLVALRVIKVGALHAALRQLRITN